MVRILLIEDDRVVAKILKYYLCQENEYDVTWAKTGGEALGLSRDSYDIILLDILLLDINGVDLCERLRSWHSCPIIFISCLDESETIVRALEAGGDDFLVKPFDNTVLAARINANLRRVRMNAEPPARNMLKCCDFSLDAAKRMVVKDGKRIKLSPIEFRLLSHFMQHRSRISASVLGRRYA